MMEKLKINIVVDNDSWILLYAEDLVLWCSNQMHDAKLCRSYEEITNGDIAFYLGCVKITPAEILKKNKYNLVVHESDLPKGRGFAPMAWQILEGKNRISLRLIEAAAGEADSGRIFGRSEVLLEGHELCPEWRSLQGETTVSLCQEFVEKFPPQEPEEQDGEPSYYKRRRPADSRLDVNKTIAEQFDLLRIVDNENYPAFFEYRGQKYKITIEKDDREKI